MILDQALIALPLLLGAYLTLSLLKLPDFSLESAYLFGAVAAALLSPLPAPLLLLSAALGGALVGGIVTTLNQSLKLPFLLAAIITNGLFHGATQYLLGTSLKSFAPPLPCSETLFFLLVALALILFLALLFRSPLGYSFAIYGHNPHFFDHHPVSGRYVTFTGVMIGHACAGIGGLLFSLSNGLVDLTMNRGVVLLSLTALLLGKLPLPLRRPTLFIPLAGLFAYFCLQQTVLHTGLSSKYFNSFQALSLLIALALLQRKKPTPLDHLGV